MAVNMCTQKIVNITKLLSCVSRNITRRQNVSNYLKFVPLSNTSVENNALLKLSTRTVHTTPVVSYSMSEDSLKKAMEQLTDRFTEARELIEDARESQGTVYFSDDMTDAQEAVKETLSEYKELLSQLNDEQRQNVMRSIGLRMEELKAQQAALEESLKD